MDNRIFLTTTKQGTGRAAADGQGGWQVETGLPGQAVHCLAADPLQAGVVYAATESGVLCSADYGRSWQLVGMAGHVVTALAASPHQPGVLYAGTRPAYLYHSADGGATWAELEGFRHIPNRRWWFSPAGKPYRAYVQAITLSPAEPGVILAGIELGAVVRSADHGRSWSGHRPGSLRDCHSLTFHQTHGNWAYEAGGTGGGASASRDGGRTWTKAKAGLGKHYGVACAADPQQPEIWYVSVAPGPGQAYGASPQAYLYRADGGAAWRPIGWAAHPMAEMPIALATVRDAPGHLYAGTTAGRVWHTADYGENWQRLPFSFPSAWRSLLVLQRLSL